MRRILLGIIFPIVLIAVIAVGAWWVLRLRSGEETPTAPGTGNGAATQGLLEAVSQPVTTTPRPELGFESEPSPQAPAATTQTDTVVAGAIPDDSLEPGESGRVEFYLEPPTRSSASDEDDAFVPIPDPTAGTGGASQTPVVSGSADNDGDGLTTDQELQQGTSPTRADTDNDGLSDGEEVRQYRTDPLNPDTDGDGLTDGEEVLRWNTDPLNPDTDGDGYLDGAEVEAGYNPNGAGAL